ncbi:hypothetical protein PV327_010126 [Microctonus hyperodae]|uniref:Uncharacterized protein n=1 Tax=Microctonus hyperodae TaxID=165561 RepID=A0AA39FRK2_MICHY|nr:hypothetical protein PV327_010126 [Microctonus hyperodae]
MKSKTLFLMSKRLKNHRCDVPPPGFYNPKYDIAHKGVDTDKKMKRFINNPCLEYRSTDCNSIPSIQKAKLGTSSKVRTVSK